MLYAVLENRQNVRIFIDARGKIMGKIEKAESKLLAREKSLRAKYQMLLYRCPKCNALVGKNMEKCWRCGANLKDASSGKNQKYR